MFVVLFDGRTAPQKPPLEGEVGRRKPARRGGIATGFHPSVTLFA